MKAKAHSSYCNLKTRLWLTHVLEGSVRKAGNRVRITAQLIEARSDTHLWSETYDRELDDIFAIQDEIAAKVLERLQFSLLNGEAPSVREVDPQAYALYLQATQLARQGSEAAYREATELLHASLALTPDYPQAWMALAGIYVNLAGKSLVPWEDGFAQAREATENALAIDPDFALAHDRLGWIAMIHDDDLAVAARHYRRALTLAPANLGVISDSAQLLRSLGRIDASVALDQYLVSRDPLNALAHFNLGGGYIAIGEYNAAVTSLEKALVLNPKRVGGPYRLGVALLLGGDAGAALEAFRRESVDVLAAIGEALALHGLGNTVAADAALQRLETEFEHDAAYNIAYVHAFRSENDAAFAWLEKAVAYGDPGVADIIAEPLFAGLRNDHRWLPFMASINRDPAVLNAIVFEVRLPQ
jgi:tetratricopeptide (TPR) repeat protein